MPSRKKKYNARFPAGRIKKIMQSDEDIGKVAKAVPVIISKTLELFVETLLAKTVKITNSRNAKTLSPSHMKQCIMSEKKFDFLRDLVKNIPDISAAEEAANYQEEDAAQSSPDDYPDSDTPYDLSMASSASSSSAAAAAAARRTTLTRSETMPNGSSTSTSSSSSAINSNVSHVIDLQRSLSQNGYVSSNRAAGQLKRESDIVQRLQQHLQPTATATVATSPPLSAATSVIRHTTSLAAVNSDYLPNKLARSDVISETNNNTNCTTIKRSPHKESTTTPSKLQNAIPAPIVSFDFCNKPVVKIDYSNLATTAVSTSMEPIAPLSAPAKLNDNMTSSDLQRQQQTITAFDFNATAPVINIDLSNIVPPLTLGNNAADAPSIVGGGNVSAPKHSAPSTPIATITIGNLPCAAGNNKINSKVNDMIATTINTAVAAATAATTTAITTTNCSNSLDLDEDYDNI